MEKPRLKKILMVFMPLIFFVLFFFTWYVYRFVNAPLLPENAPPILLKIEPSMTASQVATLLKKKQLIDSSRLLLLWVRYKGLTHQLKAGVYEIKSGETIDYVLKRLAQGDVITRKFAIIAGTTQQKITHDLMQAEYLSYNPEDWSVIQGAHINAEGLVLADTYQYQGGSSSRTLLLQAHRHLMTYLEDAWAHKEPNLPYNTPYELLIAASIIEKETAIAQERVLISGVMVNRLRKKMPLQMDPTIIYGLAAEYNGKLTHDDMHHDTPYNSYLHLGLPPTPIAMVGKESIDAAAHPQFSNYLYFVARGDRTHQFSSTYEQQRQAIKQYQHKDKR